MLDHAREALAMVGEPRRLIVSSAPPTASGGAPGRQLTCPHSARSRATIAATMYRKMDMCFWPDRTAAEPSELP
jgi:hypothetical protein